jgi:2-keto-3-deoxy-galactonokinase
MDDFRANVAQNRDALLAIAKKNPHMAYQKVNELALFVGSRHGVNLQLHFPVPAKVADVDSYGTENVGIVVDKFRRTFPVPRETVKQKAAEILGPDAKALDAYMYEGKEGVKVVMAEGALAGRLEVLPGSMHLWCKVDDERVKKYADWLMENVYFSSSSSSPSG